MRIHFSNVNFSSNSGPNSFASRLANELSFMGHKIVSKDDSYDSMLIFIEPSSTPAPGAKLVHRIDGIWFKPDQFHTHNKLIKWAYDNSSEIIWQSEFDRQMTEKHWGIRSGAVINNGMRLIDHTHTTSSEIAKIRESYDYVFVCSSNWHRQKRLKENIGLFLNIKREHNNSCLLVLGSNPDYHIDDNDIYYTGSISHEMCLQIYSIADWMIHLAWLDHCPNVVVEALSQKCPVICTDSGGTHELVRSNGIILPETRGYYYELTDYDDPYELLIEGDLDLSNRPNVDNSRVDIASVAQRYLRILEN